MANSKELVNLYVEGHGVYKVRKGENLGRFLSSKGLLPLPCGGNGLCGLCRVFVEGSVSPPSPIERMHGFTGNTRLACQTKIMGDLKIRLIFDTRSFIGKVPRFSINVDLKRFSPIYRVREVQEYPIKWSGKYFFVSNKGVNVCEKIIELNDIMACVEKKLSNILLIDLGTTKIAYQVYNDKAELIAEDALLNPLLKYGSDIITRATKALEDEETYNDMHTILGNLVHDLALKYNTVLIAIAGNSIMESIFMKLPLDTLVEKPYQPIAQGPFIYFINNIPIMLAPLISGFVGGDAFANLITTEYIGIEKPYMIIDLGTNTEIILVTSEYIYASSAPAGPAFEGYITSGIAPGYRGIHDVRVERVEVNGKPSFKYRGEPVGFMGSGIISLVAELLRHNLISSSGRFLKGYERYNGVKAYRIADGEYGTIVFTQKDLREFQKALAAVKSGWRILLEEAGIDSKNLKYVVLSGSFGSSINVDDAIYLKIVPVDCSEKVLVFGNSVLTGLRIYVFDQEFHVEANKLLPKIIHVNLAEYENYMNIWIKSLNLGNEIKNNS